MQNFDHNIGFREKRHFFRRKLSKIAEKCDHNIDPRQVGHEQMSINIDAQPDTNICSQRFFNLHLSDSNKNMEKLAITQC
jgi:hypothetical protein